MKQIAIVDYGMGNIESVVNAFDSLNVKCVVTNQSQPLGQAAAIILPGVGAFPAAMQSLQSTGLVDVLQEQVLHKQKPFLGICLGMQLIAQDSTEQQLCQGLGWVEGHVIRLDVQQQCAIPHVGWNEVEHERGSVLYDQIEENAHFFFDHSYHLKCETEIVSATCHYGVKRVASIEKDNIFATQFHPEKSQRNGLKLLRNFLKFVYTA